MRVFKPGDRLTSPEAAKESAVRDEFEGMSIGVTSRSGWSEPLVEGFPKMW